MGKHIGKWHLIVRKPDGREGSHCGGKPAIVPLAFEIYPRSMQCKRCLAKMRGKRK